MVVGLPTRNTIPFRPGSFTSLADALDYAAGGATGLCFYDSRGQITHALTYARLRDDVLALAGRMRGAGLTRGDRVAIVGQTHPDTVTVFLACGRAGLVPALVPMPGAFSGRDAYVDHVCRLTKVARASALFVPEAFEAWFAPFAAEAGLKAFGRIAALADAPGHALQDEAEDEDEDSDIAYLQFSSGSTRFPAGIAVTGKALMENIRAILRHGLQVGPDDRAVSWLPFYHDMGLVGFLLAPLAAQVTVDLFSPQDFARRPHLWLHLISTNRATLSYSPSFGYELCARRGLPASSNGPGLDLSAWRVAGIGGDVIRPDILAAFARAFAPNGFRDTAFVSSYGLAEATLAVSFAPLHKGVVTDEVGLDRLEQEGVAAAPANEDARARRFVACGAPLPGTTLEIRDAAGAALPERHVGRVVIHGPSLMLGYDVASAQGGSALADDGWLDTGDLGYLLHGQVVITGRAKEMIIVNGRNLWPQDLEWLVEQATTRARSGDAVVFATEEDGKEKVVLLLEARGVPAGTDRLRFVDQIAGILRERHGVDAAIVLVQPGSLPRTSSGKLRRSAARDRYRQGALAAVPAASGALPA